MRTPNLTEAFELLEQVNQASNLDAFATWEFTNGLGRFSGSVTDAVLPNLYTGNPYAPRTSYRVRDLPDRLADAINFTTRAYFVLISTTIEGYAKDLLDDLETFNSIQPKYNDPAMTQLATKLHTTVQAMIGNERSESLDYLRKRRNAVVHGEKVIRKELKDLITNEGSKLNSYWASLGYPLAALDFSDLKIFDFTQDVLIDCLRVARHCLIEMDKAVLSSAEQFLAKHQFDEILLAMPGRITVAAARRKARAITGEKFGVALKDVPQVLSYIA